MAGTAVKSLPLTPTQLLARMLGAADMRAVAAEHVSELSTEFFITSTTYLTMVGRARCLCRLYASVVYIAVYSCRFQPPEGTSVLPSRHVIRPVWRWTGHLRRVSGLEVKD